MSAGLTSPQYKVAQEVNVISSAYNRINQSINKNKLTERHRSNAYSGRDNRL